MESNNNLTKNEYLEIQKCNKMVDIMMWACGYRSPLFNTVAQKKFDKLTEQYEECLKNIKDGKQ